MYMDINDLREKDFWNKVKSEISSAKIGYCDNYKKFLRDKDIEIKNDNKDEKNNSTVEAYIYKIYKYAIGKKDFKGAVPFYISKIMNIVLFNPWGLSNYNLDNWEKNSYVGFLIYYSDLRISILYRGKNCTAYELAILSGVYPIEILEKINQGIIKAENSESESKKVIISNNEAKKFIRSLNLKIYEKFFKSQVYYRQKDIGL